MPDRSVTPSDAHVQASWNGAVIADSSDTIMVEGNHYFPRKDVMVGALAPSGQHSHCPWKGDASYHDLVVEGLVNPAAAWYYPDPFKEAEPIRDHIAFWRGVEVSTV